MNQKQTIYDIKSMPIRTTLMSNVVQEENPSKCHPFII